MPINYFIESQTVLEAKGLHGIKFVRLFTRPLDNPHTALYRTKEDVAILNKLLPLNPNIAPSVLESARDRTRWNLYEILNLSQMGDSMKETVVAARQNLEDLRAMSSTFFKINEKNPKIMDLFEIGCLYRKISYFYV